MRKPKKVQFRAPPKKCVYCGGTADTTRDHVPPRSLFLEPLPKQLITVPACSDCNGGFGELDTAFQEWLGFSLGVATSDRSRYWTEKLLPNVQNNQRRRREIVDRLQAIKVTDPIRQAPVEMYALPLEADIQERMIVRLVRGLWFKEFHEILPADVPIRQMLLPSEEGMEEFFRRCKWHHMDGQFSYGVGLVKERPWTSCWFFLFHGGNVSMAFTGEAASRLSNEEDEASSARP